MNNQRGVALITVLLVCAIASVICSALVARQQLAIRSSANHLDARQALHYALGGEAAAQHLLHLDWQQNNRIDHLNELWAKPLPPLPFEHGFIALAISDLSGRFNLNNLWHNGAIDHLAYSRFQRLLALLQLDPVYAPRLIDWLDPNQQPITAQGAEDNAYLRLQTPYRNASQPLHAISELRLLLEMSEEDYQRLAPYISALPAPSAINVNTAQAMVLASLIQGLSLEQAGTLAARAKRQGFNNLNELSVQPALQGLSLQHAGLALRSDFFRVHSEVSFAGRRSTLVSDLQRAHTGQVRVLSRDLSHPSYFPDAVFPPLELP